MELHVRQCRILKAVINDYVESAEPIGSQTLAKKYDFGVKPATIRNEMAIMADMGYLRQPHTSAGRIPSDMGYRFYVDSLMPPVSLKDEETVAARKSFDPFESEVEEILQRTCRILSGLTRYASIATTPRLDDITMKQVALLSITKNKIMAVIIINNGRIDHRSIDIKQNYNLEELISLTNYLNRMFEGSDYRDLQMRSEMPLPPEIAHLQNLYDKVTAALKLSLTQADDDRIFIEGASNILKEPEFTHSDRVALIMDALEDRQNLFQMLGRSLLGGEVSVVIGSENSLEEMKECSFVASTYTVGTKVCGSIAVIGPTRMNYERAVAAVRFMASNLSSLLTSLSIG